MAIHCNNMEDTKAPSPHQKVGNLNFLSTKMNKVMIHSPSLNSTNLNYALFTLQ